MSAKYCPFIRGNRTISAPCMKEECELYLGQMHKCALVHTALKKETKEKT